MQWHKNYGVQTLLLFVVFSFVLKMSSINCSNGFSFQLFNAVAPEGRELVLSASDVQTGFAISYFGSVGETATEIEKSLHLLGSKDAIAKRLKSNNAYSHNFIYVNKTRQLANGFKKYAVDERKHFYNKFIDFSLRSDAAARIINIIDHYTNSSLKHLDALEKIIDASTSVLEVNVVDFVAEWKTPFETEFPVKNVTMMRRYGTYLYGRIEELSAEALVIPFKNTKNNMLIVLPDKAKNLESVKEKLELFASQIDNRLKPKDFDLYLPKFDISVRLTLNEALHNVNLKVPFQNDANFTQMLKGELNSHINHVLQSARVTIDLKKVDLKSATVIQFKLPKSPKFLTLHRFHRTETLPFVYVNRPFIFAIRTKGKILALGAVSNNFNLVKTLV